MKKQLIEQAKSLLSGEKPHEFITLIIRYDTHKEQLCITRGISYKDKDEVICITRPETQKFFDKLDINAILKQERGISRVSAECQRINVSVQFEGDEQAILQLYKSKKS